MVEAEKWLGYSMLLLHNLHMRMQLLDGHRVSPVIDMPIGAV